MYSIKAVTALTGLTPETLRAWERRYECVTPQRTENGRRFYTQEDLEKLTLLVNLTRNGHAIGKIANLSCEQLRHFRNPTHQRTDNTQRDLFSQILDSLQNYRIERCEQLLKRAMLAHEPVEYARDVLLPVLHQVGLLWHQKKLNVAQEHLFSGCVKRIVLTMVNNLYHTSKRQPAMLFATPSGEPHELGILLGSLVASTLQYHCYYLGADLPAADIIDACEHLAPRIIVIGLVKNPPDAETAADVERLVRFVAGGQTQLWIAGAGGKYWASVQGKLPANCLYVDDIDEFYSRARQQNLLSHLQ
ncbi:MULTISPECIES: MerR family transcriptional regulator [Methylomonas]|uniref:MerR family transcriptional regulator n=1 Tax=Methylomonas TaxID=416 RepID=UPI0012320712|nr:MerR family transcriptional regulator [Methylomonas rhizoryzae]